MKAFSGATIWIGTTPQTDLSIAPRKMIDKIDPGPRMDLANMRANGVRYLSVSCLRCRHEVDVDMAEYPGELTVKSFETRFVCTNCGSRKIEVRPAWNRNPTRIAPPFVK